MLTYPAFVSHLDLFPDKLKTHPALQELIQRYGTNPGRAFIIMKEDGTILEGDIVTQMDLNAGEVYVDAWSVLTTDWGFQFNKEWNTFYIYEVDRVARLQIYNHRNITDIPLLMKHYCHHAYFHNSRPAHFRLDKIFASRPMKYHIYFPKEEVIRWGFDGLDITDEYISQFGNRTDLSEEEMLLFHRMRP